MRTLEILAAIVLVAALAHGTGVVEKIARVAVDDAPSDEESTPESRGPGRSTRRVAGEESAPEPAHRSMDPWIAFAPPSRLYWAPPSSILGLPPVIGLLAILGIMLTVTGAFVNVLAKGLSRSNTE